MFFLIRISVLIIPSIVAEIVYPRLVSTYFVLLWQYSRPFSCKQFSPLPFLLPSFSLFIYQIAFQLMIARTVYYPCRLFSEKKSLELFTCTVQGGISKAMPMNWSVSEHGALQTGFLHPIPVRQIKVSGHPIDLSTPRRSIGLSSSTCSARNAHS
jgi:hypothetical protein